MAIFGTRRDIKMLHSINRELINAVISQQVGIYKYKLKETKINSYGESSNGGFFNGPFLIHCLIKRDPKDFSQTEVGVNQSRKIEFRFLIDELKKNNLFLEVGDIILYEKKYYSIDNFSNNQYIMGKDNDFSLENNLNHNDLDNYGDNLSLTCSTHQIPDDKLSLLNFNIR